MLLESFIDVVASMSKSRNIMRVGGSNTSARTFGGRVDYIASNIAYVA